MKNLIIHDHVASWGNKKFRCAIGAAGISAEKQEGDNATPVGSFPLRYVLFRSDSVARPNSPFPTFALTPTDGWCDDVSCPSYNRQVTLPHSGSHEKLWRDDYLYNIIVILGYNDDPPQPGKGSAVFLHIARENFTPTAGCVALSEPDMREFLTQAENGSCVTISP